MTYRCECGAIVASTTIFSGYNRGRHDVITLDAEERPCCTVAHDWDRETAEGMCDRWEADHAVGTEAPALSHERDQREASL